MKLNAKSLVILSQVIGISLGMAAMKRTQTQAERETEEFRYSRDDIDFSAALDGGPETDEEYRASLEDNRSTQYEKTTSGVYSFENDYDAPRFFTVANASGNYKVDINLSALRMRVLLGDVEIMSSQISPGRPGHRTPTGNFRIIERVYKVYSEAYKAWMYYNHFFTRRANGNLLHAIHRGSMASRSHGCVRLPDGAAQKFWELTGAKGEDNFSISIH